MRAEGWRRLTGTGTGVGGLAQQRISAHRSSKQRTMSNTILASPLPPRGATATGKASTASVSAAGVAAGRTGAGVLAASGGSVAGVLSAASSASSSSSRLSASEMAYIGDGVLANLRADGRARLDYRPLSVETGVVPHANGSARLRLGTAATDVLVAVNLSMVVPEPSATEARGSVVCNVEHSAACTVDLDERALQAANAHLTSELQRVLTDSGALPLRSLVIIPDAQVWLVNIDVLVMDNGGNLLDAIVMAVKAALLTTTIPPLEIVTGDGGAAEITVNDDPFSHLPLAGVARLPLAITLSKVAVGHAAPSAAASSSSPSVVGGAEWILDATSDEEQCSSVRLTLSLSPEGRLAGLSKGGVGTINLQALDAIMAHAAPLGVQLHKLIQQQVNKSKGIHAATDGAEPAPAPVPVASPEAPASSKSASKKKKQQKQQAMEE